jgi:AcrR family transcriptional regulator
MEDTSPEVQSSTVEPRPPRRVSRQREAGAITRLETRRRVLAAATQEFAERGFAQATVARIAARADVAVQTVYHAWGSKHAILRAMLENAITDTDTGFEPTQDLSTPLVGEIAAADTIDPHRYLGHLAHRFRGLAERAAVGWQTYRDAAAIDTDIATDWQVLQETRREAFDIAIARLPPGCLRPGLTRRQAADTAWVIASPEAYELLVRRAGLNSDEFEHWVRTTLIAALLR